jgi:hypothetical protein
MLCVVYFKHAMYLFAVLYKVYFKHVMYLFAILYCINVLNSECSKLVLYMLRICLCVSLCCIYYEYAFVYVCVRTHKMHK